jgi:hypothetical protein
MWTLQVKQRLPFLIHPVRVARWISRQCRFPGTALRIERAAKGRVLSGPFKGLRIPTWQHLSYAELIGVYEHDLEPIFERMMARKPRVVIDVGAAYGYYALGFAMRLPQSRVIAYETDPTRRSLLQKFAGLNGLIERVDLRGECTADALRRDVIGAGDAFVLMDVEGAEATLLEPALVRHLGRAELLIELHEMFVLGVTQLLQRRFAATHDQRIIAATPLPPHRLDLSAWDLGDLDYATLSQIVAELREGETSWLHLTPRKPN